MYLGEMEGGHYNNATNDQELNQYRGSGEGRKDLIFRMWNLIELDDQLDIGDKRKAWKTDSVDSVLDGREFERKRDNESSLEHMELECLESIWKELFGRQLAIQMVLIILILANIH